jgi:hypothetical protein
MSRDETTRVCRSGARAILVSSESPVSREYKHHKEDKIEPASRELVVGGALSPGLRGFALQDSGKHVGVASELGRSRRQPCHMILPPCSFVTFSSTSHHLRRMMTMLAVVVRNFAKIPAFALLGNTVSPRHSLWYKTVTKSMSIVNATGLMRAVLPRRNRLFMADLGAHSTYHALSSSPNMWQRYSRAEHREDVLSAHLTTLRVAQWRLELSATQNSIVRHHVH